MADITKCKDCMCSLRETCYRYTAKPSDRQSYFIGTPRNNNECEYYWETKTEKNDENKHSDVKE
jgi:hypothetical protein